MLLVTSISPSLSFKLLDVEFSDGRSGWKHDAWSEEEHLVCVTEDQAILEFVRYRGTKLHPSIT
jgi:hypothetical protein